MALTPSTMVSLGSPLPDFALDDAVSGRVVRAADFADAEALLVMFICNHCPFVVHVRDEFARLEKDYAERGLRIVAINSNDVTTHPQDGPEHMKSLARSEGWGFPFLFDATQDVARAFGAACTPDFFLYDGSGGLVYRGQLDESRPGNDKPVNGKDLRSAIEAVLSGETPSTEQQASVGCNIKWATN